MSVTTSQDERLAALDDGGVAMNEQRLATITAHLEQFGMLPEEYAEEVLSALASLARERDDEAARGQDYMRDRDYWRERWRVAEARMTDALFRLGEAEARATAAEAARDQARAKAIEDAAKIVDAARFTPRDLRSIASDIRALSPAPAERQNADGAGEWLAHHPDEEIRKVGPNGAGERQKTEEVA